MVGREIYLDYGRLTIEGKVGEGGMGLVYRGVLYPSPTGVESGILAPTEVAAKILRPEFVQHEVVGRMFHNEAKLLRRLRHPNIVEYIDSILIDGRLVVLIEYVDGQPLDEVIARHVARHRLSKIGLPCLPFLRAWYYFEQLLGALATSHALGIVHRDIKPPNVLIRRDGIVKLTDFGIARLSLPHAQGTKYITQGFASGTGMYMSPEQVLSRELDARSDLYSAAIVLYEMIAGRPPFLDEGSEFAVRHHQIITPPPSLRTLVPQAPTAIDELFARSLSKAPEDRFPDAIAMGHAFRTALGIPPSDSWGLQEQFARGAQQSHDTRIEERPQQDLGRTRELMLGRYQTMKLTLD